MKSVKKAQSLLQVRIIGYRCGPHAASRRDLHCTSPGSEAAGSKVMEALARLWTCEPQCEIRDLCQPKSQPYRGHAAPAQQLDSLQENREDPKPDAATENTKVIVAIARLQESRENASMNDGEKSKRKPRCARTFPCSKGRSAIHLGVRAHKG